MNIKLANGHVRRLAKKHTSKFIGIVDQMAVANFIEGRREHHVTRWDKKKHERVVVRTFQKHLAQ